MCSRGGGGENARKMFSDREREKRGGKVKKSQLPMRTEKNIQERVAPLCVGFCLLRNNEVKDSVDDVMFYTKVLAESVPADTLIPTQDAEMGVAESISQTGSVFS